MKISEWQRRYQSKTPNKREKRIRRTRRRASKKSSIYIGHDPFVCYTINPLWHWTVFTIEAILLKSHEWKCVTHKIISMVIIIIRESMPKMRFIVDPFSLCIRMAWYRRYDKFCHCCFSIDYPAVAAEMEANLNILYLSSTIQCAEISKQCEMTHACPNVYPWYCVVIDLMRGSRSRENDKKKRQKWKPLNGGQSD